ncbi:MAG TPA: hypothetical protein VFU21_20895 [Kofleriaceae bacterium]|nr:hypothetical protein [Kofleriaceae bacterium]
MSHPPPHHPYPQHGGLPPARRVSPGLYLVLWWVSLLGGGAMTGLAVTDPKLTELVAVCWLPLLIGAIAFWVLIYKAWSAIQDGQARTTPGKAVGFLFIPFFNIYWLFVAIGSWGKQFNAFGARHGVPWRASEGLFVAHCIFSLVPVLAIISLITGTSVILQFCRGINAIADRQAGGLPIATAHQR